MISFAGDLLCKSHNINSIPAPLLSATHLKLNVAKAGYSARHAHFDCMFPEEMVLKSDDAFDDVTSRFVLERVFSGPNYRQWPKAIRMHI